MKSIHRLAKETLARRVFAVLALAALAAAALAPAAAGQRRGRGEKAAAEAGSLFAAERGKFRVVVDGATMGSEEFQISRSGSDWVADGKVDVRAPGAPPAQVTSRLRLTAEGVPLHYEWSSRGEKKASATIVFQDGAARVELLVEGEEPHLQGFIYQQPLVVILDNNLYHHYAILARLYDWKTRGIQSFPVLIPQDLTPGSVSVEAQPPQDVRGGGKLEVLRVSSPDLAIDLYLDNLRLVRIAVPGSPAEVIRD